MWVFNHVVADLISQVFLGLEIKNLSAAEERSHMRNGGGGENHRYF